HALQRLEKHHRQKQQQRRRSLRRQVRLQPQTRPPHETQIQQRQEHAKHRVNQIALPSDLQKIRTLHSPQQLPHRFLDVKKRNQRKHRRDAVRDAPRQQKQRRQPNQQQQKIQPQRSVKTPLLLVGSSRGEALLPISGKRQSRYKVGLIGGSQNV